MLAGADEEDKFIKCFDDITGKELSWQAGKQARDGHAAVAKYNVTSTPTIAFEEDTGLISGQICMRESPV